MHLPRILATLGLAAMLAPGATRAAESFDNCTGYIDALPAVISTQGTWCLRKDLATAQVAGAAITISTNNVTIDCNDFKIGGLAAGTSSGTAGILATNRLNATVRRCSLRGFKVAINLLGLAGGGHRVEDDRIDSSLTIGISVEGDGSIIRRNIVRGTGSNGEAMGIRVLGDNDVIDNTVAGVAPQAASGGSANATGIYTQFNGGGSVRGNRVRGLVPFGGGVAHGIFNLGNSRVLVQGNHVVAPGVAGSGISCENLQGRLRDNIVNGFAEANVTCSIGTGNDFTP